MHTVRKTPIFAREIPCTQLRTKALGGIVPSWDRGSGIVYLKYCVPMSDTKYRLVAWTENGEVRFSAEALQEQEALLWDEYHSLYYAGDRTLESMELLCRVAWQWGRLLLRQEDYRGAYGRFSDGIIACRSAGCYPPVLEDLCEGCREAAGREGGTLEEILYEEGIPIYACG